MRRRKQKSNNPWRSLPLDKDPRNDLRNCIYIEWKYIRLESIDYAVCEQITLLLIYNNKHV